MINGPASLPRQSIWELVDRSACLVIDLDAIESNVAAVRDSRSSGTRVMAVVKADGYGHGAALVADAAIRGGASARGGAPMQEALALRQTHSTISILILSPSEPRSAPTAAANRIAVSIGEEGALRQTLDAMSRHNGAEPLIVHLKVDTGMRRFGIGPENAVAAANSLAKSPRVHLEGVFTQFAAADDPSNESLGEQWHRFQTCLRDLHQAGHQQLVTHAANSAAILRSTEHDLDLVRLGISLYGIPPSDHVALLAGMRPAMAVKARLQRVMKAREGDRVSYGCTYQTAAGEWLGLVPVGYADGIPRALSNKGWVGGPNQSRLPIRGRVCMDQLVVGLGNDDTPLANVGAEVTLMGDDSDPGGPAVTELAAWASTIPYEICTSLSLRLPRIYLRDGAIVAYDDGPAARRLKDAKRAWVSD